MKKAFFAISFLLVNAICNAQITVDTTSRTMVMVKEKTPGATKALNVYRIFQQGVGTCHKVTYQPDATIEIGDEPPTMRMTFADESAHIKAMLDAAQKKKQYNFASISFNVTPYSDLVSKLADAYLNSPEWNAYLKRTGDSLYVTTTLWDGNEVKEIAYNQQVAAKVLENGDLVKAINNLMLPYGYQVKGIEFLTDHPEVLRPDQLQLLGKNGNFIVPVPHNFVLRKVK
jgi:hypothetical protein